MSPEFPLHFTDEEGTQHVIDSVPELEETIEYVDDFDPPYRCEDSRGRRVRVVMWDLQLLCLQIVPEDYDGMLVEIVESTHPDGTREWLEMFRGKPLRSAKETPSGEQHAEPERWDSTPPTLSAQAEVSTLRPEEFHDKWLGMRGFRR
ncbi:hypothetical protein ABZ313_10020 [Streptomyces sp. NPDC006251]|uniref:hypothetical protein n=1 Tax=Streptomyces sp. NPDC006251 TaxID=3155718 RepID=UPI0033BCA1E5